MQDFSRWVFAGVSFLFGVIALFLEGLLNQRRQPLHQKGSVVFKAQYDRIGNGDPQRR